MTASAPLIISGDTVVDLTDLRRQALEAPVHMTELMRSIKTPDGERRHRKQMTEQTVVITEGPWKFWVTFSFEIGHPCGVCRHMSMSTERKGKVPSPEAAWAVAEILGFCGALGDCAFWLEDLRDGGKAVNLVQPVNFSVTGNA